jgi:hypothetical protein
MPKFTLICDHGNEKTTVEFEKEYLPDVLENFEMFLRGSGYHFNGNLALPQDIEAEQYHHV